MHSTAYPRCGWLAGVLGPVVLIGLVLPASGHAGPPGAETAPNPLGVSITNVEALPNTSAAPGPVLGQSLFKSTEIGNPNGPAAPASTLGLAGIDLAGASREAPSPLPGDLFAEVSSPAATEAAGGEAADVRSAVHQMAVRGQTGQTPSPSPNIEIIPAGCDSCGTLPPPGPPPVTPGGPPEVFPPLSPPMGLDGGCACGSPGQCVPGRTKPCYPCKGDNPFECFLCELYGCVCCPDPCYEPRWTPVTDAAFFVEAARPVNQTRFRWDAGQNLILPDRSAYFWARADGNGLGPAPREGFLAERSVRYNDLVMVTEGGNGLISLIAVTPYRSIQGDVLGHSAGFSDISIGTKSLLFDCELLQISMMMMTHIPAGNPRKGLGVGHVSLEPSLLVGLKLKSDPITKETTTFFQGQLSERIPLGGDRDYAGAVLHYHASVNHVLVKLLPDVPLVGTCEFNGWSFQDGAYTDPVLGALQKASGYTYASAGGGLRLFICDRCDMGVSAAFSLSQEHFARELYRMEFRYRY